MGYRSWRPSGSATIAGKYKSDDRVMPVLDGSDYAIERRTCVVSFDQKISDEKKDIHLKEKLLAEKSGIFNAILHGLTEYRRQGLNPPLSVIERTKKFVEGSNLIREFIEDCLEVVNAGRIGASDLYAEHRHWMEDNAIGQCP